jgi:probable rRNA maturation factor
MTLNVDVQFASEDTSLPESQDIAPGVSRAMAAAGYTEETEISVRVVDPDEMQELNKAFRDQDKPTNVLSFPAGEIDGLPSDSGLPLGDIVICAAVVKDEAEDQGKSLLDHWAHMIVHGTLHLLGFDHLEEDAATAMESLEIQILGDHGIANPYGESPQET